MSSVILYGLAALGALNLIGCALVALYIFATDVILARRARQSEKLAAAYLAGLRAAPMANDLAAAPSLKLVPPLDDVGPDDDPLVEIEVVVSRDPAVEGEYVFLTLPDSTPGVEVVRGALSAAEIETTEDAPIVWEFRCAGGYSIGLGADAGTLATMSQPLRLIETKARRKS